MRAISGNDIRSRDEALLYMIECTLATVSDLAGRSRPPKGELSRQIAIAQTGIDAVREFLKPEPGMYCGAGRVQQILDARISVKDWATSISDGPETGQDAPDPG